jgi:Flp pilus assembly protein TadB
VDPNHVVLLSLLIPVIGMPFGGIVLYLTMKQAREERELLSKERLAAIERGLDVALFEGRPTRSSPLRSALVVLALGVGVSLPGLASGSGSWVWGAAVALVGVALLAHWFVRGRNEWDRDRALDEELRRAYIDRFRAGERAPRPEHPAAH